MKTIKLGTTETAVPAVIQGCMRLTQTDQPEQLLETTIAQGINFFDHADIYGGGECEKIFGQWLKNTTVKREDLIIQSKCGIRKGFFDFSKEHIIASVENSLRQLNVEYLDLLLLHRPDALVEPEEVAAAFDQLAVQGKVRQFGVSNHKPLQIELLKKTVRQPLVANQLQFGIKHSGMVDQGLHVNMMDSPSSDRDGSILDYSRIHEMTIQAWSPYQYGFFDGAFIGNDQFPELNQQLSQLAETYGSTPTGLATAWILRHPANMQVVVGSMNPERIQQIAQASEIVLSREDWYSIYLAAGNILP